MPMASAALRAVESGDDVVVFTRGIEQRDIKYHRSGESTLTEITRWMLHVQSKSRGRRQILCIRHSRNITERWTTRFDWRLPCARDGAGYPFCVPEKWWLQKTLAFKTVESKPCWVDALKNGWARPSTNDGAGHHWDVFIHDQDVAKRIGLDQINVVEVGAPAKEGDAGWIHHVPEKKSSKVDAKKKRGWTCN
jgi:hypothetical protein